LNAEDAENERRGRREFKNMSASALSSFVLRDLRVEKPVQN